MIKTKSIHDPIEPSDGQRILVSKQWPKYATRDIVDIWFPELGHDLELAKNWQGKKFDWNFFKNTYLEKIKKPRIQHLLKEIASVAKEKNVTLIGHARRSNICHRTILKEYLDENFIYKRQ